MTIDTIATINRSYWVLFGSIMHICAFVLIAFHCLRRRREPAATVLWIFVAWSFPLIGPLIYLGFGIDRIPDKGFHKHINDQRLLAERKAREDAELSLSYWRSVHEAVATEPQKEFERNIDKALNTLLPEYPLLGGNSAVPLISGDEFYPRLLDAIDKAEHHIHIQSFIICDDSIGRKLLTLLHRKAEQGVKVRLLYDKFGSARALFTGLFRNMPEHENLHLAGWSQVNPLKQRFQINLRNHRKSVIIDGKTAFFGGINIHDENISTPSTPAVRDYHFEITGPVVQEIQYSFMRDWYYITDEDPEELLQESHFPQMPQKGDSLMRLVNSGPTSEMEAIADVFFMLINAAVEEILIVTPYFVPTTDLMRALRTSALRGVNVRLVVPQKNNHFYAGLAGRALYQELLDAGVRIYERHPPFIHAKAMLIDSSVSVIGTSNFDNRSLRLNYETNLVVYDEAFANSLKQMVLNDIAHSTQIIPSEWQNRSVLKSIAENLAYLMMPVL
jgi:cardiolipin synthase